MADKSNKEDEELDKLLEEMIEKKRHETLEQLTDDFTCYPMWWNDSICFLRNPKLCIPGVLLDADECEFYFYASNSTRHA